MALTVDDIIHGVDHAVSEAASQGYITAVERMLKRVESAVYDAYAEERKRYDRWLQFGGDAGTVVEDAHALVMKMKLQPLLAAASIRSRRKSSSKLKSALAQYFDVREVYYDDDVLHAVVHDIYMKHCNGGG